MKTSDIRVQEIDYQFIETRCIQSVIWHIKTVTMQMIDGWCRATTRDLCVIIVDAVFKLHKLEEELAFYGFSAINTSYNATSGSV